MATKVVTKKATIKKVTKTVTKGKEVVKRIAPVYESYDDFDFEEVAPRGTYWKPEEGACIAGLVENTGRTHVSDFTGDESDVLSINTKEGLFILPTQKQLNDKLEAGGFYRITYEGMIDFKDGKKTKRFKRFKVEKGTKK